MLTTGEKSRSVIVRLNPGEYRKRAPNYRSTRSSWFPPMGRVPSLKGRCRGAPFVWPNSVGRGPGCISLAQSSLPLHCPPGQPSLSPQPRQGASLGSGEPWALMTYRGVHPVMDEKGMILGIYIQF